MTESTGKPAKSKRAKKNDPQELQPVRAGVVIDTTTGRRTVRGGKRKPKAASSVVEHNGYDAVVTRLEKREQMLADDIAARDRMMSPLKRVAREMRRGHKSSSSPLETPTPNRALQAGERRLDAAGAYHCETVLATLANRGVLAKRPELNRVLFEAGEKYLSHWTLGYRIGVAAQDINREGRAGFTSGGMALAENATHHAEQYRRASQALGPYLSAAVDAIVLNEEPVESVGRRISGYKDRNKAIAVAMDRLREGLSQLATLWGTLALDPVRTRSHLPSHESEPRPNGKSPKALRTHRTFAGMSER